MDIIRLILVILHLIGFAALFGGAFVQMKGPKRVVNPAMWHGVLTMLVTGILLTGVIEMGDGAINHMKIGIKLLLTIVTFVMVLTQRKKAEVQPPVFFSIFGLTIVNLLVAVLVSPMHVF